MNYTLAPSMLMMILCVIPTAHSNALPPDGGKAQVEALPQFDPKEAGKYVLLEASLPSGARASSKNKNYHLFNAQTGEIVIENFSKTTEGARLIEGDSRRMFFTRAVLSGGSGVTRKYFIKEFLVKGFAATMSKKKSPVVYVAADWRRVFWVEDGDFWRGDLNAFTQEISNKKRVTSLGVFQYPKLLLWSGNYLFLNAKFDPEKPIVRINLYDGAVEELDWFNVIDQPGAVWPQFINPDLTIGVRVIGQTLDLIDLTDGRKVSIGNVYPYKDWDGEDTSKVIINLKNQRYNYNAHWYDNTTLMVVHDRARDLKGLTTHSLDLSKAMMLSHPIAAIDDGGVKYIMDSQARYSPAFRYTPNESGNLSIKLAVFGGLKDAGQSLMRRSNTLDFRRLARVDYRTGEATLVPNGKRGTFASNDIYLYTVDDAGLSKNGIWMFDRKTGKSVRISGRGGQIMRDDIVCLPELDIVMFTQSRQPIVYQVKTDGSGFKELDKTRFCGLGGLINTNPIDLGVADSSKPAWREMKVTSVLTRDPVDIAGIPRLELLKALEGEPDEVKRFGVQMLTYVRESYTLGNFFKHVPATLAIVEEAKKEGSAIGDVSVSTLISKVNLTACYDIESTKRYGRRYLRTLLIRGQYTKETIERMAHYVGDGLGDYISSLTNTLRVPPDNEISRLIKEAQAVERARTSETTKLAESTKTAEAVESPGSQPVSASPPTPPAKTALKTTIDDAVKGVDKALKGLFRRRKK